MLYLPTANRNKKRKSNDFSSITLGYLHSQEGSRNPKSLKRLQILFYSGCENTIVNQAMTAGLTKEKVKASTWKTKSGSFTTGHVCEVTFKLPLFHKHRDIAWKTHVDPANQILCKYDLIIGRDLLSELGIDLQFSKASMVWDNVEVPMQQPEWLDASNVESFEEELFMAHDPVSTDADRIQRIIGMKYKEADLPKVVEEAKDLYPKQQQLLLEVLQKFEVVFDGTLGDWQC